MRVYMALAAHTVLSATNSDLFKTTTHYKVILSGEKLIRHFSSVSLKFNYMVAASFSVSHSCRLTHAFTHTHAHINVHTLTHRLCSII